MFPVFGITPSDADFDQNIVRLKLLTWYWDVFELCLEVPPLIVENQ